MYICTCTAGRDQGKIVAVNTDGRCKVKDVGNINFFIFYHLDDDTSKHVLQIENYTKEWVLLQATV